MNVEELFVLFDIESRLEDAQAGTNASPSWLHDLSGRKAPETVWERERLRYLLVKTIVESERKGTTAPHDRFAAEVLAFMREGRAAPTIITTNWDTTLEAAFRRVEPKLEIRYGCFEENPAGDDAVGAIEILKLHGSIDWWVCRACRKVHRVDLDATAARWEARSTAACPRCQGSSIPLLVPPVGQKFGYDPVLLGPLSATWWDARKRLNTCDSAAFMGYSFPPTDAEVRAFVRGCFSHNLNLRREVVVTNAKPPAERATFEAFQSATLSRTLSALEQRLAPQVVPMVAPTFDYAGFTGRVPL